MKFIYGSKFLWVFVAFLAASSCNKCRAIDDLQQSTNSTLEKNKDVCQEYLKETPGLEALVFEFLDYVVVPRLNEVCGQQNILEILASSNQDLKDYVTESSSITFSLSKFIKGLKIKLVECKNATTAEAAATTTNFVIRVVSETPRIESTVGEWRRYATRQLKIQDDDLVDSIVSRSKDNLIEDLAPSATLSHKKKPSAEAPLVKSSGREKLNTCEPLGLDVGLFQVILAPFAISYELNLTVGSRPPISQLASSSNDTSSSSFAGLDLLNTSISNIEFGARPIQIDGLEFLSNSKVMDFSSSAVKSSYVTSQTKLAGEKSIGSNKGKVRSQTVSVLHDNNNRYRKNDWQLELVANWLRHELQRKLRTVEWRSDEEMFLSKEMNNCVTLAYRDLLSKQKLV